jgi:hypothetical protein
MKNLFKSNYCKKENENVEILFFQKINFNISKFLFPTLIVLVMFIGCNSDSAVNDTKLSADVVQKLKQDFVTFELKNSKYLSQQNKYITEIYTNNILSGYLLQDGSKNTIGFSNITNSKILKYHDFIIAEDYSFDITYSSEYKCNIPNFKKNNLLEDTKSSSKIFNECTNDCQGALITCAAVTVIAAVSIAASDGPLPFMDVLAASAYVAGMANCGYSNKSCLRGC